jgi:hypothetical protein
VTSVQHFTEEPPDGTIVADGLVDQVFQRADDPAHDGDYGDAHWFPVGTDDAPFTWPDAVADLGDGWQILYRQEDVDRLLAAQREQIALAIEALDPVEAALAGQHAWSEAAKVARAFTEGATR